MRPDPLKSFLDFNKDGKIDIAEEFIGYKIFEDIFKEEDDEDEDDDE